MEARTVRTSQSRLVRLVSGRDGRATRALASSPDCTSSCHTTMTGCENIRPSVSSAADPWSGLLNEVTGNDEPATSLPCDSVHVRPGPLETLSRARPVSCFKRAGFALIVPKYMSMAMSSSIGPCEPLFHCQSSI